MASGWWDLISLEEGTIVDLLVIGASLVHVASHRLHHNTFAIVAAKLWSPDTPHD
jgi:hypothetical protein